MSEIKITIRCYEELNEFLPPETRKQDLHLTLGHHQSVGTLTDSLGIARASVDLILVNGQSVNMDYMLQNNDRISVYPVFERLDITSVSRLKNSPKRDLKFICDVHLGRLAKYLRMLGFDTVYQNDYNDFMLIRCSLDDNRILLTRDKALLLEKSITRGYRVIETVPELQIREILDAFDLAFNIAQMTRCLECNALVRGIDRELVKGRVAPAVFEINDTFTQCTGCGKIYWKGSHYQSMMTWIREMRQKTIKKP